MSMPIHIELNSISMFMPVTDVTSLTSFSERGNLCSNDKMSTYLVPSDRGGNVLVHDGFSTVVVVKQRTNFTGCAPIVLVMHDCKRTSSTTRERTSKVGKP